MSGIEIAGLVLGAFPLLIHALESYHESLDILRDWYKVQRAYRHSIRTLGIQKIQFERNVERFLLPLVVDDVELKELMADPAGERWEDPDLETRLQQRLPESYKLFLETIVEINRVVESLKQEMGVTNSSFQARVDENSVLVKSASRVDLMSRANFEFQSKRIKFSLKKSTRERLFKQLEEACNQMQKLLELDDQIITARQQRSISKSTTLIDRKINDFWRHAKRLHGALTKAWQCGCLSHTVNLGRTSDRKYEGSMVCSNIASASHTAARRAHVVYQELMQYIRYSMYGLHRVHRRRRLSLHLPS
ncbi:hypothetical protein C7974DRAFT_162289 [Boeremia exigua]|uniref:uncharacterized protein n=1 Tax=Boeremia exigua TaxID=749465 RepID=UPI001E8E172E|nr:uncharacterized protein C7974DRAFT_162289 [Boeremia exigua]KAH6632932.1 hypothetical protein C7974DRAFT_162289 [Boeremia exigua]